MTTLNHLKLNIDIKPQYIQNKHNKHHLERERERGSSMLAIICAVSLGIKLETDLAKKSVSKK